MTAEHTSPDDVLRPKTLEHYVGQKPAKQVVRVCLDAAEATRKAPPHMLMTGPPGLGKTTLAEIVASEMGTRCHYTSGPVLDEPGPLCRILAEMKDGDVLFIDEIHRMGTIVEEFLYPVMERFAGEWTFPGRKGLTKFYTAAFTLIGASAREGLLTKPFRSRFPIHIALDFYSVRELAEIILASARLMRLRIGGDAPTVLARAAQGAPRIANNLLRFAAALTAASGPVLTREKAAEALTILGIDEHGLHTKDRALLKLLMKAEMPLGAKTIAASLGEELRTVEDSIEPYLLRAGYLLKTPRGRIATQKAYDALGGAPAAGPGPMPQPQPVKPKGGNGRSAEAISQVIAALH